jgi:hypothetical protein
MGIITRSGRTVIAESIAALPIHLAVGTGDGAWTSPPTESQNATALLTEVGRRVATSVEYAVPDVDGELVFPDGSKYSISESPTSNLYLRFDLDYPDASSAVLRESGVFVGSTMVGGLPGGQKFFLPNQVATPGRLLRLENFAPIFRSLVTRDDFQVLITF